MPVTFVNYLRATFCYVLLVSWHLLTRYQCMFAWSKLFP